MLEDAGSEARREHFRAGREEEQTFKMSFDEYISFLDSTQKIFGPFKVSSEPTLAKSNKL